MTSFTSYFEKVCDRLKEDKVIKEIEEKFNKLTSDFERVTLVLEYKKYVDIPILTSFKAKSSQVSNKLRQCGNKLYTSGKNKEALKTYSQSISFAENKSKELGLAYANRSAVLYALSNYLAAISDIEAAFDNFYPENLSFKLCERLGKCYMGIENFKNAEQNFKLCKEKLNMSQLNEDEKKTGNKKIDEFIIKCREKATKENKLVEFINAKYELNTPELDEDYINEKTPCTTKSFKIVENDTFGRYAVASKTITPGEIIAIEKAFTALCLPSCFRTHCYHCLKRFQILYPCQHCADINYCSIKCQHESWEQYHRHECEYIGNLTLDDIGLGHLALKMICKIRIRTLCRFNDYQEFLKKESKYEEYANQKCETFYSGIYQNINSLVGNSHLRELSDLFRRTLLSIYLTKILDLTRFFRIDESSYFEAEDDVISPWGMQKVIIVASSLLKQIQMLPCNAHEVSELDLKANTKLSESELKEIGSALFTTLSLLNHSCDPSVVRHCYGDTCVVRAIKRINIGEEIVDNYGFLYPVEKKVDRIKHLKEQYYFTCSCIACTENWPLYQDLIEEKPNFLCSNCKSKMEKGIAVCHNCKVKDQTLKDFYDIEKDFQSSMENVLNDGNIKKNLPLLLKYLDIVSDRAVLPTIHLNNCQEIVKLCFAMQGNFYRNVESETE